MAIKLDIVEQDKSEANPEEELLPEDGFYRYLYQSIKKHEQQKRRVNHIMWSNITYRVNLIVKNPDDCILYYSQDGPGGTFEREELMHIPIFQSTLKQFLNE